MVISKYQNRNRKQKTFIFLIIISLVFGYLLPQGGFAESDEEKASIQDLQEQIKDKAKQINEIGEKISVYEKEIDNLRDQAATLKGHINILDSQINKTEDEVNLLANQIQQKELEIKKITLDINLTQEDIDRKLDEIKVILTEINSLEEEYLGTMEMESQGILDVIFNFFKIIIKYSSWSEYEKTVEDTCTINELLKQKRDKLKDLKASLEESKKEAENKARELVDHQRQLVKKQEFLAEEKEAKRTILAKTQANEEKYEELLEKEAAAQRALNREVIVLKEEVKKKIAALGQDNLNINAILTWPIPYRRITSSFGDPFYPFRRYFEHNAIDIACPQGTPIYAPAAGYVARTRDAGYGYNYITLIHSEKLQTRYGHVSSFAVTEGDFVKAGQIIGYTGGTPGTAGAGNLTTGPHLHFEVRIGSEVQDEITSEVYTKWAAVNPLEYLP